MHIPDGFIDLPTSVAGYALSTTVIGVALKQSRRSLNEATAPMAGLAAVFVFAAQMINFPVAAGTSGHLIGGALAAMLIGPWAAILAMTVVVGAQALIFADGGLTALGLNLLNMAIVPVLFGWFGFRLLQRLLPKSRVVALAAMAVVAYLTVPLAASMFSLEYAIGGTEVISSGLVFSSMLGVHLLIGIGEAAITTLVVAAVAKGRPDLVKALASTKTELIIKEDVR